MNDLPPISYILKLTYWWLVFSKILHNYIFMGIYKHNTCDISERKRMSVFYLRKSINRHIETEKSK